MKVSIIIPVYNAEKYIPACAEALMGQTFKDTEIIFVNDGSTDRSSLLCAEYADIGTQRGIDIKVINKGSSEGAGPARNSGMDTASGEFIMFLDVDDIPLPDMIEKLYYAIEENGCDTAVCGYEAFTEGANESDTDIFRPEGHVYSTKKEALEFFVKYFPEGIAGYLWNKIYRASVIKENGIRFPDMRRLQDGMFNVSFFGSASSCCVIPDVLYRYRVNAQTDIFKKCPPDYYDLIKRFTFNYIAAKKSWGNYSDIKINNFFMNETGTCIENTISPQWSMARNERKAYLAGLSQDEFLVSTFTNGEYEIGRYRKILLKMLIGKHFTAVRAVVGIKTRLKSTFAGVFYFIKRIGR